MYCWYVLWVDVQVNLQSSDRLIKITQIESGRFLLWRFYSVQCIMYCWYVLWVDVQVNLQSSDQLIKITQIESGAFLLCFCSVKPPFPNKLQRIMYSWYVLWVQSSDRLIKKIGE